MSEKTARMRFPMGLRLGGRLRNLLGPCALVGACAAAILYAFGVHPLEMLRFAAYEAGFALIPGWVLYLALKRSPPGLLRQVAAGWALGYVLQILAYAAASALGVRSWFVVYPVLVVLPAGLLAWRRHGRGVPGEPGPAGGRAPLWVLAVIYALAMLYLSVSYFSQTPLPGTVDSVSYYPDLVWDMGLAAEALHHWPMTDPNVAGTPLSYYTFAFIQMAAISRVTGLGIPLLLLRLYVPTLLLLLAIQLYLLGTETGRTRTAGVLTVVLVLLAGEIDPYRGVQYRFLNVFFPDLYLSPTFLLGLVLFPPLVVELGEALNNSEVTRDRLGDWLIVGLLLIGCGGAKGTILPVVAGGLGLTLAYTSWVKRRINWAALTALALALLALGSFYLLAYGHSGIQAAIRPLSTLYAMPVIGDKLRHIASTGPARIGAVAFWVVIAFIGLMGIRALGLAWLAWARRLRFSTTQAWLLALFLVALVPYYALGQVGESQVYFFWYGYVAAGALAAEGLELLLRSGRRLPLLARALVPLALAALLATQLLDTPLNNWGTIERWLAGRPTYVASKRNLTPGLLEGMDWIRLNTPPDAVLAVNNYYSSAGNKDARYFYYAAFAERRVFLEGWMYTSQTHKLGYALVAEGEVLPFPDRFGLNQRLFERADPAALQRMESQYGVSYLVLDKVHRALRGGNLRALGPLATPVFANNDVEIYAVGSKP